MANLIDKYYFKGEINIPGLQSEDVLAGLEAFISKYETQYLQSVLGYAFWKLFIAGLEEDEPAAKWVALRDGAEYTDADGIMRKWAGFKNTERISPIADYVYYWYSRDSVTFTTTSGEVKGKQENAVDVSAALKQSRAYNSMVDANNVLWDYLTNAVDGEGAVLYADWDEDQVSSKISQKLNVFNL